MTGELLRQSMAFLFVLGLVLSGTPFNYLASTLVPAAHANGAATSNITATKSASFNDSDGDGKAKPGQTITYSIEVTNNGTTDAQGVVFSDNIDSNTSLVTNSVSTTPLGVDDTFSTLRNDELVIGASGGLLANDRDPDTGDNSQLSASGPSKTTNNGDISIALNGSFTYTPPLDFEGTDSFTYTVTDTSGSTGTATVSITVAIGAAHHLALTTQPSSTTTAGASLAQQPVVQVQDAANNPVAQAGVSVTAAIASGGGILGGTTSVVTNASGVATFDDLSISGSAGDRTLAFSANGLDSATSGTITVNAGAASRLVFGVQPVNIAAGAAITPAPQVRIEDVFGNLTASTSSVTVALGNNPGNSTLSGTATVSAVAGVATFSDLSLNKSGTGYTLRATSGSLSDATSETFNVSPAAASTLAFGVQPSDAVAGASITPAVKVRIEDNYGNLVTGATNTIGLALGTNPGSGTLSGTTSVDAVAGIATFSTLSLDKVGTGYTLVATATGLSNGTSSPFNLTHGPLHHFRIEKAGASGGDILVQLKDTAFAVKVTAQDEFNNTVTSFTGTVTFSSTPSSGISAGATSVAFTSGVLSTHSITFGTAGAFTLTATGGGVSGTSNSFEVHAPPTAVAEGPTSNSAPGQPFHAFYSTADSPQTFTLAAPGLISNDNLGFPVASIASFGGGAMGGTVDTNLAGATAVTLSNGGSLAVGTDGTISFRPPNGFTGNYTFNYKISNSRGASSAQVTIAVGARPSVVDDPYGPTLVGNVGINTATSTGFKVSTNDTGDGVTRAITTQSNGVATINSDGTFTFLPNVGYEGAASFAYTITNGFGTTPPATVSLNVGTPIWFVNAGATNNGNGRYASPFNNLTSFANINNGGASGSNPAAGDHIFLYSGTYSGPLTLLNNQRLIGQGATASLSTIAGVSWPADAGSEPAMSGPSPTLTATNATALTLANAGSTTTGGNILRGFNLGTVGTTGTALSSSTISGSTFGTLTLSEVNINTNGRALNLSGGTLANSFPVLISSGGANNVSLTNVATAGTIALGSSSDTLSGATGDAFVVNGSNGSFTYNGTISNSTARSVNVLNKNGGTVTLAGNVSSSGNGTGVSLTSNPSTTLNFTGGVTLNGASTTFTATGGGTVSVTGSSNTIGAATPPTSGIALNITDTNISASGLTFKSISVNGANNGIVLKNTGASGGLTVTGDGSTANSGGTLQNTAGPGGAVNQGGNAAIMLTNTQNTSLKFLRIFRPNGNGFLASNLGGSSNLIEKSVFDYGSTTIPAAYALRVENTSTNATLTLDATTFQNKMDGTTAVSLSTMGTSQFTFNVKDSELNDAFESKFTNLFGSGIVAGSGDDLSSTALVNFNVSNSKFVNAPSNGLNDLEMGVGGNATLVPNISNNTFDKIGLPLATVGVINVNAAFGGRVGSDAAPGLISGNTISNIRSGAGPTFAYDGVSGINGYLGIRAALDNQNITGVNHRLKITGNTITNLARQGILVSARQQANNVNVSITNNTVGTAAAPVSFSNRRGIELEAQETATLNVLVDNNSVVNYGSSGANAALSIRAGVGGDLNDPKTSVVNATVTNNTLKSAHPSITTSLGAFRADTVSGNSGTLNLDLRGNTLGFTVATTTPTFELTNNSGTFRLKGSGAGAVSSGDIAAANNGFGATITGAINYNSGASVPQPGIPLLFSPNDLDIPNCHGVSYINGDSKTRAVGNAISSPVLDRDVLTQAQLTALVKEATIQWEATGLSTEQQISLRQMKWAVSDLPGSYLGETTGDTITLDSDAGGNSWSFGQDSVASGRVDALTAVLHEMGHVLGLEDSYLPQDKSSIMYGYLGKGERRLPQVGAAAGVEPGSLAGTHFLDSAENVTVNIGTLPPGKSVTIVFQVTIKDPLPAGVTQISNQGTVSGSNFTSVFTDDTTVAGTSNATITPVISAPTDIVLSSSSIEEGKPVGTVVGTLSSTDADTSDTHTYSLVAGTGDTDNGSFTIDGANLKTGGIFNHATKSSYSIRVQSTDSGGLSFQKTFTISVAYVNKAPVATPASLFVPWNTPTTGTLSGTDFENSTLTFAKASDPTNGSVSVSSTGSFTYTPTTGHRGPDSFTFTVSDGTATSSPATISLTVKEDVRPDVVITAPSNNARLHLSELGSGSIRGTATDNIGVNQVRVMLRRFRGTNFSYWNGTTFTTTFSLVNATLSGTGTSITWSLDSAIPASELDAGTYFLSALANDEAFNSRYSATHTLTLYGDSTAPGVAITAPTQNQRLQTSELISGSIHGTATDNVGVTRVRLVLRRFRGSSMSYWNGSSFVGSHTPVNTTLSGTGTDITWSLQSAIPAAQLDVGTYHLTAIATDAAGNTTHSATRNFTLFADTTAPGVTISAPTQKQRLHLSELVSGSIQGTATDSVGVTRVWVVLRRFRSSGAAYWNGSSFVSSHTPVGTTLTGSGTNVTWSLNSLIPAAQLDAGSYFLTAVAFDAAGNTTHSTTREFILHNDGTTSPTSTSGSSAGGS